MSVRRTHKGLHGLGEIGRSTLFHDDSLVARRHSYRLRRRRCRDYIRLGGRTSMFPDNLHRARLQVNVRARWNLLERFVTIDVVAKHRPHLAGK